MRAVRADRAESKLTSETWFVPTDAPEQAPTVIAPASTGTSTRVEHHEQAELGDRFLIVTNSDGARNFRARRRAGRRSRRRENWIELVPHRDDVRIDAVDAFAIIS